jgi:hypothetical protein
LLLTVSLAWALYDEAFWSASLEGMQQEFVSRYTKYLDSIKAKPERPKPKSKRARVSTTR